MQTEISETAENEKCCLSMSSKCNWSQPGSVADAAWVGFSGTRLFNAPSTTANMHAAETAPFLKIRSGLTGPQNDSAWTLFLSCGDTQNSTFMLIFRPKVYAPSLFYLFFCIVFSSSALSSLLLQCLSFCNVFPSLDFWRGGKRLSTLHRKADSLQRSPSSNRHAPKSQKIA